MIQRGTHLCISTQFLFTSKHFQEPAVSTEIEQKAFIQLPRDVCRSLSRNFLRARIFQRYVEVSLSTKAFFGSPHFTQRLNRKLSSSFPQPSVYISSRNLPTTRFFHRDGWKYHFPPRHFCESAVSTEVKQDAFTQFPIDNC